MSSHPDTILDRIQADVMAVLKASPGLVDVNLLAEDEGDIEATVLNALRTLGGPNNKMGLAAVVFPPEVASAERNLPGPVMALVMEIQVLEQVLMNRQPVKGTGISAAQTALRIANALHQRSLGDCVLYADRNPITKVPVKKGFVGYVVTMNIAQIGLDPSAKVAGVSAVLVDGDLVLSCATSGAAIRYTTDGSFPGPAASLYTVPLELASGTAVRTAAYATGLLPGDVLSLRITA